MQVLMAKFRVNFFRYTLQMYEINNGNKNGNNANSNAVGFD